MALKGSSVWWVWISVLCAGTVARAAEKGQSSKDTGQSEVTTSYFTRTAASTDTEATWVTTNPAPAAEAEPTTPNTTIKDVSGHEPRGPASSSLKYWVPLVFMATALLTLYFTYRKVTERDSRSRAGSVSQSSDSVSQDKPAAPGAIPHPQAWDRTDEETRQAKDTNQGEKRTSSV